MIVGICPTCADGINARERFERLCVARPKCAGCDKAGPWDAYRVDDNLGDPNCSDCMTMTHCETHHKVEGLYPLDPTQRQRTEEGR